MEMIAPDNSIDKNNNNNNVSNLRKERLIKQEVTNP